MASIALLDTEGPVGYNDRSIDGNSDVDGMEATGASGTRNGLKRRNACTAAPYAPYARQGK